MTLNGFTVLNYSIGAGQATINVRCGSMESALSIVSGDMMIKDGVGNDLVSLCGFTQTVSVIYHVSLDAYELVLARESDEALRMQALIEEAQQEITDLELSDIEQGQQITDLELMILGGDGNV